MDTFRDKSVRNKIISYNEMGNNKVLVTYIPKLDYDIIKSHGLDILKVVKRHNDKELLHVNNTSVAISAATTAYGRIHINKIKLYILSLGGEIYYSDTDSIVTNINLHNLVNNLDIGELKLEHKVKKGIFISNKTYCLINEKDEFINRAKGVKTSTLNISDYEKLLKNEVVLAKKSVSKRDWSKGHVIIYDKEDVRIHSGSYVKRDIIYENNI